MLGHRTLVIDNEDETDLEDAIFRTHDSKNHIARSSNEQFTDDNESGDYNYVSKWFYLCFALIPET